MTKQRVRTLAIGLAVSPLLFLSMLFTLSGLVWGLLALDLY